MSPRRATPTLGVHHGDPRQLSPAGGSKRLRESPSGDRAVVCCGAIVFAGARLDEGVIIGDQAFVRERAIVGASSVIGRGSCVDNDVRVGTRVRAAQPEAARQEPVGAGR